MQKSLLFSLFLLGASSVFAQSTLNEIRSIFQANCTTGCHSGGNPSANLDLSGNTNSLYNDLVGIVPTNPFAVSKGYKLIDAGYPERSFLLRKVATTAWDEHYDLEVAEGDAMPDGQPSLEKEEIELIRQWILFGAPQSGTVVDAQVLSDYYNGMGMQRITSIPTPEAEGETGYQIRMGPFFLPPLNEVEYRWKYDINESDSLEVYRTKAQFNDESHHFILYKFDTGSGNFDEGLRPATQGQFGSLDISQVTSWADPADNVLPPTTAYKWQENTVLDLNFHILNYDQDSILAAECYVNVYTQPTGTADLEMFSRLIPINALDAIIGNGQIGEDLIIPNDGQEHTFTDAFFIPIQIPDWYIWQMSSHTHARGTDYDIYKRNANGTRGDQIYEGFYNPEYQFNQGYYDWEHAALRTFEPLLQINMSEGFIQEAKFRNSGPQTLQWGLTTEDEMMLMSIQHTEGPLLSVSSQEQNASKFDFSAFPNPFIDELQLSYSLDKPANVNFVVYNSVGLKVFEFQKDLQNAGTYSVPVNDNLSQGIYHITLTIDEHQVTKKVIKL